MSHLRPWPFKRFSASDFDQPEQLNDILIMEKLARRAKAAGPYNGRLRRIIPFSSPAPGMKTCAICNGAAESAEQKWSRSSVGCQDATVGVV